MRLRFDADQPHQRDAIAAVVDLFAGARIDPAVPDPCMVVANTLGLPTSRLAENLGRVQARQGLRAGAEHVETAVPNIAVEMETGTGKTYTYLRTALELARRYGLRKYAIVVPSVAIREGVLKTLQVTREHFAGLYPDQPYRFFAYDSARLGDVVRFARSGLAEFMVVTIDAFNKATNLLRQPSDRCGGRAPIELLQQVRPVVVLDEPQNFESDNRQRALADLSPLLCLRYGATHRRRYALCHRLTPRQAHAAGLVKTIEVSDPARGDDEAAVSERLRETIAAHIERQRELAPHGVKVLSLVFVDRVADYTDAGGVVRRHFDRHFEAQRDGCPQFAGVTPERVRAAYFAEQRRGAPVDSRTGESRADEAAYRLIMRDKERLLSFDEPVAFVFTHSALREGWDNPNVFQICTLARSKSALKKRQEIGRGVRLCVDQEGRRVCDPEVNVLRVVANDSYEAYVASLQSEWADDYAPDERPPVPSRPGQRTTSRLRAAPPVVPEFTDLLIAAAASALRRLAETAPMPGLASPNPIDVVVDTLAHRPVPIRVRRATVLAVMERAGVLDPMMTADAIEQTVR